MGPPPRLASLDPANVPLVVVGPADLACNKLGIGLNADPSIVLAATAEVQALGLGDITLAELEIVLEDAEASRI